jgi:hypothetical protein
VDHGDVSFRFEATEKATEVPPTHSQLLGTAARSKRAIGYLTQHHETVTIP